MKKLFKVTGMHCKSCELLLTDAVEDAGAKVLRVSHSEGIVEVEAENDAVLSKARDAIVAEGYKVE
ncbi:hypothetical protein AUJ14_05580 [Candidatus Micrarchaeota archaeon CG1_02_55_22]|nr:MAG: hypothetical protein AUJ14_05580 [Candidatus Micrarchaeota archaeon CG1_02_55_22]